MDILDFNIDFVLDMAHSKINNYIIPGLSSSILGKPSKQGCVRLFESTRNQLQVVTPHSHRFDFQCIVLEGSVINRQFYETNEHDDSADLYTRTILTYNNKIGSHKRGKTSPSFYTYEDFTFVEGDCYRMEAYEIHSIYFKKDTKVLFFEGKQKGNSSVILEPLENNQTIKTYVVEDWMFQKD